MNSTQEYTQFHFTHHHHRHYHHHHYRRRMTCSRISGRLEDFSLSCNMLFHHQGMSSSCNYSRFYTQCKLFVYLKYNIGMLCIGKSCHVLTVMYMYLPTKFLLIALIQIVPTKHHFPLFYMFEMLGPVVSEEKMLENVDARRTQESLVYY